jgi:thiol:disulfide interchange protein DsbD
VTLALLLLAAPIAWRTDEAAARAEARAAGKPLLIDFVAGWCAACTLLDEQTWSDPEVREAVAARFVPLRVDLSDEDATRALAARYRVKSLPTVLIGKRRVVGFVKPAEMLEEFRPSGQGRQSR